jgi:hypothetical protein
MCNIDAVTCRSYRFHHATLNKVGSKSTPKKAALDHMDKRRANALLLAGDPQHANHLWIFSSDVLNPCRTV